MISKQIELLIVKYLFHSADTAELDILNTWIANEENQKIFKSYVKTQFALNLAMEDPDLKTIKELLLKEIRKDKSAFYSRRLRTVFKYAAISILFLGLGYTLHMALNQSFTDEQLMPREDFITLQLEDGNEEVIIEDGNSEILNSDGKVVAIQKGKQLIYKKVDSKSSKLAYNTLNIPNGKRFNVLLSDGTKVFLNAGSSLTYPVNFVNGNTRKVYLTGEAYFEVAHDENHMFTVNTQELDVQVYGTKFNLSNYPDDADAELVLVQGSISLADSGEPEESRDQFYLVPGYRGAFNKTNKYFIKEKVDTSLYTAWMDGNLIFRNESFEKILDKLERQYNVVIINNNEKLAHETFNATIETDRENIEQVFTYFNKVYKIEYRIIGNEIIIIEKPINNELESI